MKDNFKLIENMLNEMGIDEIPDSFKEVSTPKSILDFNHEAERFINEPVYYILNVHDIDINKHVLEILLSIHSNVERIIVNTTLHDTDKSIVKLKNAIAAYNYMLSGDIDIPRYILYCDINNKEILKIMFYKTTMVDFTNKQIKMDTFDKVQDLPELLPFNKFIYFVNSDVARQFKNTTEPFDYNKVQNGVIGVEIVPHHDIDTMYLKWVDCSEFSVYERYSKVFNTTICEDHNIKFAENYMAKYKSDNKQINDRNEEKTYIFMVNNGVELLLMIAGGNYQPMKLVHLHHKNSPIYLSAFAVKFASYLTGDIVVVSCGGVVEYITDYLTGAILTVTNKNVEKVIYDLDMDLPVGEYLDRLLDYNLEFIYSNPNVVNAISDFLRDGDITPYINLLLLISRYIKEFTDQPAKVKQVNCDPFSPSLDRFHQEIIKYKSLGSIKYFSENILLPISKELDIDLGFESDEVKELLDKYNIHIKTIITNRGPNDINMAVITALWHRMQGTLIVPTYCPETGNDTKFSEIFNKFVPMIPSWLLCGNNFRVYDIALESSSDDITIDYRKGYKIVGEINNKIPKDDRILIIESKRVESKDTDTRDCNNELPPTTKGSLFISKEESEKHTIKLGEPKPPTLLLDTPIRDLKDILETGVYILGVDKSVHKDNLPLVKWINSPVSVYKNTNCLSVYDGEELIHTV